MSVMPCQGCGANCGCPWENGCRDNELDDFDGPAELAELPDSATNALPGSEEKIRVLAERAAQGRQLWHPEDGAWWRRSS